MVNNATIVSSLALAAALCLIASAIAAKLTDLYCPFGDIEHMNDSVKHRRRGTAIVVGASFSGLLSARVCSKFFDKVILLDAEECSIDPTVKRTRVKQHSQLHLFLGLLYPSLKSMFANFDDELKQVGGKVVPPHSVSYKGTGFLQLPDANKTGWSVRQLYISREALEALLRKLVLNRCHNVEAQVGTVKGFQISQDKRAINAVSVRRKDGNIEDVACALVVDASGTTNGSIGWLKNAGFRPPVKVTYDPAIVYTCFTFSTTAATRAKYDSIKGAPRSWDESGHLGACAAPQHYSAFLQMENDRVRTMFQTFTGQCGEPETVEDVANSYACAPYEDWQQEAIKLLCRAEQDDDAEPAVRSKVAIGLCYRVTYNADDMPANLIPLGDTILRVNPIFGQGCSKSVADALTLDRVLRENDVHGGRPLSHSFVARFLDLHYKRTDPLWHSTRAHDYTHDATTPCQGETRDWGRARRVLTSWTTRAGCQDADVGPLGLRQVHAAAPQSAQALLKKQSPVVSDLEQVETTDDVEKHSAIAPKLFQDIKHNLNRDVYKAITVRPFKYSTMSDVQSEVLSLLPRLAAPPSIPSSTSFDDSKLDTATKQQLDPIQVAQDLLVRAKTGTGKTLAFLVPAIEGRLRALEAFENEFRQAHPEARAQEIQRAVATFAKTTTGALVLSPTRELATQIAAEAESLTKHLDDFGVSLFVGGESKAIQLRNFGRSKSNDIIVATPGRCIDLLESEPIVGKTLRNSRMLILDEADTLLDMGFADDIARITEHLPDVTQRQTFLFSATVSSQIRQVARKSLKKEHIFIDTVPADQVDTHLHIPQFVTVLDSAKDQILHVLRLLAQDQLLHARKAAEGGAHGGKAIVFLPTTKMTEIFALVMSAMKAHLPWARDTKIIEIHSRKSQAQRTRASDAFRSAASGYSILITSDVSARGVDYPGVTRVIQVGVPSSRDVYIHRVGRTGRAGKEGRGDLVLLPFERDFVKSQLHDIPLKQVKVSEVTNELTQLAETYDESPLEFAAEPSMSSRDGRGRKGRAPTSRRVAAIATPVSPRLTTMSQSLSLNVLPTLDKMSVEETFASMLGYYLMKSNEMQTTKEEVLAGCKEWTTDAMDLEEAPFVSTMFLKKMGMGSNNSNSRRRDGGRGGGGFGRGGSSFQRGGSSRFGDSPRRFGGGDREFRERRPRDDFESGARSERNRDTRPRSSWGGRGRDNDFGGGRDRHQDGFSSGRDRGRGGDMVERRRSDGSSARGGVSFGFGGSSSPWS
ncbi:hypothetical protein OIO90_004218 [Microbotryomycetes sp. JL221]|nr:hypothetical protein OIO90_004218 [Microbotryomycetes sp. JL221]